METESAFSLMHRYLDEQRTIASENILSGRATPEEYHRLCGVIQGIDFAKVIMKDLATRMENDVDE